MNGVEHCAVQKLFPHGIISDLRVNMTLALGQLCSFIIEEFRIQSGMFDKHSINEIPIHG